jgi:hypothetical protein
MSKSNILKIIEVYFKIPFTEDIKIFKIQNNLTITQFLEYVNVHVRKQININDNYLIEVVDSDLGELGIPIQSNNNQTLYQRYGNIKTSLTYYIRPIHPVTKVFVCKNNYKQL